MTVFSKFNDYKKYKIITKKNNISVLKLFSTYLILNKKKYYYKNIFSWVYTNENLFIFIISKNKVKYFTCESCKEISKELYKWCNHIENDKILFR